MAIDGPRWQGVPFYVRAGKCLPVTCTEVLVELKLPDSSAFGEQVALRNYVRFSLGPTVATALGIRSKVAGETMLGEEIELLAAQPVSEEMSAYERLIGDALNGDAALFAREDTVEQEWRIVASILTSSEPPHEYQPGTWGPARANELIAASGGWHQPQPVLPRAPT